MKPNQIIITLILIFVVGIGAFFGGTKYQQKKTVSQFSQRTGLNSINGQGMAARGAGAGTAGANRQGGFRQTIGDIISADDKSITVKLTDGSSKIVLLADTTTVGQFTPATKTDLKVGLKVAVMGDQNTDGSITGRNIQINPSVPSVTPTVKQ